MPTHRRNNSKLGPSSKLGLGFSDDRNNCNFDSHISMCSPAAPKHVALPRLPPENDLIIEAQTMMLVMVAMASQYLNIYRSVWWLKQSSTNSRINFHLIDLNPIQFTCLLIGRPLILHLTLSVAQFLPAFSTTAYAYITSFAITVVFVVAQVNCLLNIYGNHGVTGILSIVYPILMYIIMYMPNMMQAYESSKVSAASRLNIKFLTSLIMPRKFSGRSPVHVCSYSAEAIRDEVDRFKCKFNARLKYILFRSLVIAYYSCCLPFCFKQKTLYFDFWYCIQHAAIAWLSAFLMLTSMLYSPQFYDVLHKASLHLGKWQKLESRNNLIPWCVWSDNLLYAQGVVVKHSKEYFKAEGISNSAEPGNHGHLRYFIVFSNPVGGFGTLLGLLMVLILAQTLLLIRVYEWYKLTSMALLIATNSLTVFRLVRTYYVLKEVYKVEAQLQDGAVDGVDDGSLSIQNANC